MDIEEVLGTPISITNPVFTNTVFPASQNVIVTNTVAMDIEQVLGAPVSGTNPLPSSITFPSILDVNVTNTMVPVQVQNFPAFTFDGSGNLNINATNIPVDTFGVKTNISSYGSAPVSSANPIFISSATPIDTVLTGPLSVNGALMCDIFSTGGFNVADAKGKLSVKITGQNGP